MNLKFHNPKYLFTNLSMNEELTDTFKFIISQYINGGRDIEIHNFFELVETEQQSRKILQGISAFGRMEGYEIIKFTDHDILFQMTIDFLKKKLPNFQTEINQQFLTTNLLQSYLALWHNNSEFIKLLEQIVTAEFIYENRTNPYIEMFVRDVIRITEYSYLRLLNNYGDAVMVVQDLADHLKITEDFVNKQQNQVLCFDNCRVITCQENLSGPCVDHFFKIFFLHGAYEDYVIDYKNLLNVLQIIQELKLEQKLSLYPRIVAKLVEMKMSMLASLSVFYTIEKQRLVLGKVINFGETHLKKEILSFI